MTFVNFENTKEVASLVGDVVLSWMLLWWAALAKQTLDGGAKKKDVEFYNGQVNLRLVTESSFGIQKSNSAVKQSSNRKREES